MPDPTRRTYMLRSTSRRSAEVVGVFPLSSSKRADIRTRMVFDAVAVDNPREPRATFEVTLRHQRRHSQGEPWQDIDSFDRRKLKSGEEVGLPLDSEQVLHLFEYLCQLYAITAEGVPYGERSFLVLETEESGVPTGDASKSVRELLKRYGDRLPELIDEDLLEAVSVNKLHERRQNALTAFGQHLGERDWAEKQWRRFFKENIWIFGYGLSYVFMDLIRDEAYVGGQDLHRRRAKFVDYLMRSRGRVGFTVLVDVKTPGADLVKTSEYRPGVFDLGHELVGGVSQLQSYLRFWEVEGSEQERNADMLRREDIYTCRPKGILVVGHMQSLLDDPDKLHTFELFRQNLHSPEIVTFDELYERASFVATNPDAQARMLTEVLEEARADEVGDDGPPFDDVPF